MLSPLKNRNEHLRFRRLRRLINQHLPKPQLSQPPIKSRHTRRTNHIGILENLILSLFDQIFELFVLFFVEFALFVFFLDKLLHFGVGAFGQMFHLLMQRQIIHITRYTLPTPRTQPHHLQPRPIDLLRQLINSDIRRGAHQNLPHLLLAQMVHQRRRSDGLTRPRWPLNQTKGRDKRLLHRVYLEVIQFGHACY